MATNYALLYTVASFFSISAGFAALALLPLTSLRADRNPLRPFLRFLPLLSLTLLSLFGALSIQCVYSPPSATSHWISGVAGCLAVLMLDLYLVALVWTWEKRANGVPWIAVAWTGSLIGGTSMAMHIALLVAGSSHGIVLPLFRSVSHIAFDVVLSVFFVREVARYRVTPEGSSDSGSVSNERNHTQYDPHRFSNPWRPTSVVKKVTNASRRQSILSIIVPSLRSALETGHSSSVWDYQPFRLLMLQPLSIILFIACICVPTEYTVVDPSNGAYLTPYTLFGTRTSPTGAILLSVLQVSRWISVAIEMTLCSRISARGDFHLEDLRMQQDHGTPALSDSATYDSVFQQHKSHLSPSIRGRISPSRSSISYIHSFAPNKRARFASTSPLRVATASFDASATAIVIPPPAPSLLSHRKSNQQIISPYGLPTELYRHESTGKGKQKEGRNPARLSGLHLSLDTPFDLPFDLTRSYTPVHTPAPAHAQRTTSPSPSPKPSRNSRRRRGASDASIRSAMEIEVEGDDPFCREPSFEATEEMWRKRSRVKRDSEEVSDVSVAGSLRGELLEIVAEEVSSTPGEDALEYVRDQTPSPRPPSPPVTPLPIPMKVNIIAPTPTQGSPLDEKPPPKLDATAKISLPSNYEDPFPPPGTEYPAYTLPLDPVSPLALSFSRFQSSSAPPIGEHRSSDTRPVRPSLPTSWTTSNTASFSTVKSWSLSTSMALKKMRKVKDDTHVPGNRDSSHSDESFSCVGDGNENTPPRETQSSQQRQRETYSTLTFPGLDDDLERISMPTLKGESRSPSPKRLKILHLPRYIEDDEATRTSVSDGETRRSWWRIGGKKSPALKFSEEGDAHSASERTSSQTDEESSARSRTTTPRPPSPPFSLELTSSYGSPSENSSQGSSRSIEHLAVEAQGQLLPSPPLPRLSPFAFPSDKRDSAEIRSEIFKGQRVSTLFSWASIFDESGDKGIDDKCSVPNRRQLNASDETTSSTIDESDSISSSFFYSPNRATVGSITCSEYSQTSHTDSERRLLGPTGVKSRKSQDSLSVSRSSPGSRLFLTPGRLSREGHSALAMLFERENDPDFNLNTADHTPSPPSATSSTEPPPSRHHARTQTGSGSSDPTSSPILSETFSSPSSLASPISPTFSQPLSLPDTPASSVFGAAGLEADEQSSLEKTQEAETI